MTRSARIVALLAVFHLIGAGAAMAGFPDPANSECPDAFIKIVGHNGVVGDPAGEYCVTIRDFNNVPVANAPVIIDFSNCGLQLCSDQLDPGVTVDCVAQKISRLTDVAGRACFRVIGKRRPGLECTAGPVPCVEVWWDQVFVCGLFAVTFDLDPAAGMSGNDLSEFLHLFFDCGVYLSAIDYNGNGQTDGDDLSQFLKGFFAGGSALNCPTAAKCP